VSAGNELWEAETWLRDTLAAGTALTALLAGGTAAPCIHSEFVPQGSALPGIIISVMDGDDAGGVTGTVNASHLRADIRAVVQDSSYGLAGTIMAQAHALIAGRAGTVLDASGGTALFVCSCVRERPFRYPEIGPGGLPFRHMGGTYRLWVNDP
jgi:hypothetical protein